MGAARYARSVDRKQRLLKQQMRRGGMHLRWNNYEDSEFEGWLSRGDRRLGAE